MFVKYKNSQAGHNPHYSISQAHIFNIFHKLLCFRPITVFDVLYTSYSKQVKMVAILSGGGAYGVKTVNPDSRKGDA
ncbi:hypothetical protein BSR26_09600 [Leuconostoc mesenteroides subsp. mesenteroides]|nr:hypothetical protein BSR26_09600 [Leuconostoc mesenteroides subsp. mesenteroides]KMY79595.1 hypothetical protein WZ81_05715 [Leuconostoc mesenteroides subsp. cremoris]ORI82120.1 hypothetical protein BMS90_02195 [Leuconostoc mesenteroides subsp. mesenteroides]